MSITPALDLDRVPPQSLDAEMSVLGAALLDREAILKVIEILGPGYFYKTAHNIIFEAIIELFEKNEPVDLVTLTELLRKKDKLDEVGGAVALSELLNSVPTAANVEFYAKIVREKYILRRLINTGTQIVNMAYLEEEDVEDILDRAEQLIFDVVQKKVLRGFTHIKDMLHDSFEAIERLYAKKQHVTGISSGFIDLDEKTSGFHPSDLIIIAGRPSMGKSSLSLNIAQHAAVQEKVPVAIFSLEMSGEQVVSRLLCSEARVDAHKLRTGMLSEQDWPRLTTAAGILADADIFIDDTPAISMLELRAKARRLKLKHNIGLIIIDYLQLMQCRGKYESRQQEISEISRSLKALAKELNLPIIALSQLSRAVEARTTRRPQLSDLRESGAIEQDADLVLFVYRPEYYDPTPENEGIAEIIIGKHRNGPIGSLELAFIKKYARFENLSKIEE
jgi:replicative DNA helicase